MKELLQRALSAPRRRREVRALLADLRDGAARYEWRARIASGVFSEVEACLDRETREVVAVKRLRGAHRRHPGFVATLLAEGAVLAELDHPAIPRLLDVFVLGGRPSLALPFVDGQSLALRLATGAAPVDAGADPCPPGGLAAAPALAIFRALAQALAHAHERGIVHLDVKPDNILIGPREKVVLIDWASARVFDHSRLHAARLETRPSGAIDVASAAGVVLATPAYMSPEQTLWPREMLEPASDVFSAGAVLYEMLTGVRPFDAPTHAERIGRVRTHVPAPLGANAAGLSPELPELVARMLAKKAEERPADMREVLAALG